MVVIAQRKLSLLQAFPFSLLQKSETSPAKHDMPRTTVCRTRGMSTCVLGGNNRGGGPWCSTGADWSRVVPGASTKISSRRHGATQPCVR